MNTESGLTIAFICNGKNHNTFTNYEKFGNNYWDDAQNNNSKIGYYFIYYFRQEYVYVHKIINILSPSERPLIMSDWNANRNILCLSERLKQITWNEWITGVGLNAPYTPIYRSTQTCSWTYDELKNHPKFNKFDFNSFINVVENNQIFENIRNKGSENDAEIAEMEQLIIETKLKIKMKKRITDLRAKNVDRCEARKLLLDAQIKLLIDEKTKIDNEINEIISGIHDDELVE